MNNDKDLGKVRAEAIREEGRRSVHKDDDNDIVSDVTFPFDLLRIGGLREHRGDVKHDAVIFPSCKH